MGSVSSVGRITVWEELWVWQIAWEELGVWRAVSHFVYCIIFSYGRNPTLEECRMGFEYSHHMVLG
jgi:hypothetical protein